MMVENTDQTKSMITNIHNCQNDELLNINSDNKIIYEHLLQNIYVSENVLSIFKLICVRNTVNLSCVTDKNV